jgi:hypothetical protein
LSGCQYGFQAGKSTVDALLMLQHQVLSGFEKCEAMKKQTNVCAVFFDVSKAFDTVPFDKLLIKLHDDYHVSTSTLGCIRDYLTGRTMRVRVEKELSGTMEVTSGVVQGSALGPTLFAAYINEVAQIKLEENSQIIMFADDIVLTHPLTEPNSTQLVQNDVSKIQQCMQALELQLNVAKCKFMVFSLAPAGPMKGIQLSIGGDDVQQVKSYRYLGVELDEKLSYTNHTEKTITKAKQAIGAMNRTLRKWAPAEVFSMTVSTIAIPVLLYAIEVWYPPGLRTKQCIEKLQKFAARMATNDFQRDTPYEVLLKKLGWKPLYRMVAERRLMVVRSYMDGKRPFPESIFALEGPCNNRTSERLAAKELHHSLRIFRITKSKNGKDKELAASQMCRLWNALTEEMVRQSTETFRNFIHSEEVFNLLRERGAIESVENV